jgi:hypothetical protein
MSGTRGGIDLHRKHRRPHSYTLAFSVPGRIKVFCSCSECWMKRCRLLFAGLVIALSMFATGCAPDDLTLKMDEGIPARFRISGPGKWAECCNDLSYFAVMEDQGENRDPWENEPNLEKDPHLVWKIEPEKGTETKVRSLDITYGKVPAGWRQTFPATGEPAPLAERKVYFAGRPHYTAFSTLTFIITGNKVVSSKISKR